MPAISINDAKFIHESCMSDVVNALQENPDILESTVEKKTIARVECFGCDRPLAPNQFYFTCHLCKYHFHKNCTILFHQVPYQFIPGDDLYEYTCVRCTKSRHEDTLFRYKLNWIDVAHIILLSLTNMYESEIKIGKTKYFHWKVIMDHARVQWPKLWIKTVQKNWVPYLSEAIVNAEGTRFQRARSHINKPGYYALMDNLPSPKQLCKDLLIAYRLSPKGLLIPFTRGPLGTGKGITNSACANDDAADTLDGSEEILDLKNLKFKNIRGSKYRDTVYTPFDYELINPSHEKPKFQKSLSDPSFVMTDNSLTLHSPAGYRLAKCSHGATEGAWFYEFLLVEGNARVGWASLLADMHAPLGYDEYGYSYADKTGNTFHCRMGRQYGPVFSAGDVIGCLIELPVQSTETLLDPQYDTLHDQLCQQIQSIYPPIGQPILNIKLYLPLLLGSKIHYFKNGKPLGVAFENLYHAKYRPAISLYKGKGCIRFTPPFEYPPPSTIADLRKIYADESIKTQSHSFDQNNENFIPCDEIDNIPKKSPNIDGDSAMLPSTTIQLDDWFYCPNDVPVLPISDLENFQENMVSFDYDGRITYFEQRHKRKMLVHDPSYKHPVELENEKISQIAPDAKMDDPSKVSDINTYDKINTNKKGGKKDVISKKTLESTPTDIPKKKKGRLSKLSSLPNDPVTHQGDKMEIPNNGVMLEDVKEDGHIEIMDIDPLIDIVDDGNDAIINAELNMQLEITGDIDEISFQNFPESPSENEMIQDEKLDIMTGSLNSEPFF